MTYEWFSLSMGIVLVVCCTILLIVYHIHDKLKDKWEVVIVSNTSDIKDKVYVFNNKKSSEKYKENIEGAFKHLGHHQKVITRHRRLLMTKLTEGDMRGTIKGCRQDNLVPTKPPGSQNPRKQIKWTFDNAMAECPCCCSRDVGAAGNEAHCYMCGFNIVKFSHQEALDAWNTRGGVLLTPEPKDENIEVLDTWYVKLPGDTTLVEAEIKDITENTVEIRIGRFYDVVRYKKDEVEFVERRE